MKWFNRTAQAFTPGFGRHKGLALTGRPRWWSARRSETDVRSVALVRHIVLVLVLERVLLVAALDLYLCAFSELRPADAGLKMLSGRVA